MRALSLKYRHSNTRNARVTRWLAAISMLLATALLPACSQKGVQGIWFPESEIHKIKVGEQNKEQILQFLGPPNLINPYRPNIFYYFGAQTRQVGRLQPKLRKQQLLILRFEENTEILLALELRDISKVKHSKVDKSKTKGLQSGKRSLIRDIFGNIGQIGVGGP